MIEDKLVEIEFSEVVFDLNDKRLDGKHVLKHLPDEADMEKVLSSTGTVNYFVYTKTKIFSIWIETDFPTGLDGGNKGEWDDCKWEIIMLER